MIKVRVHNMYGRTGRSVANQFVINTEEGAYMQSYRTVVVFRGYDKILLDPNWDCSRTTTKYVGRFLGRSTTEIRNKIKSGEYKIAELN